MNTPLNFLALSFLLAAHASALPKGKQGGAGFQETAKFVVDSVVPLATPTGIRPGEVIEQGPDLDLGFNGHVEARITLAPDHRGDLALRYVCTDAPGTTPEQVVKLPEAILLKDGLPHTYRVDMGLEVWWRGRLRSLSVEKASAVIVGDGEGIEYVTLPAEDDWRDMKQMESKHFRIVWGKGLSKIFTERAAHGTLRNFEEAWQFFVKGLRLKRPYPIEGEPGRYRKVNIATHHAGYSSGGGTVSMDPSGLRMDPPSRGIPHELMHTFQEVQGGRMAGMWCESHADYATERWLRHIAPLLAGTEETAKGPPSCFNPAFATMSHWYLAHGRDYYLCWPIWAYLDENPDALPGLGGGTMSSRLWQEIREGEDVFSAAKRLTPSLDVPTLLGHYARRNVTWNYANGDAMRRVFAEYLHNEPRQRSLVYADLLPRPDAPGWWHPLAHQAPQPGGYTQHELDLPQDGRATVDLRALHGEVRASLVAIRADGSEAGHAGPFAGGAQTFEVPRDAERLVLVVAATPEKFEYWTEDEMRFPMRTHPMRRRHHYVVKFIGTEPLRFSVPREGGRQHPNGGGFVADTAKVAQSVYVGKDAAVLDEAQIEGDVIIDGSATVRGAARVSGEARILGHADVENAVVSGQATIEGQAHVWRDESATITGDAVLTADYGGGRAVANGFQCGFVGWVACPEEWITARTAPKYRWVNYEFDEAHRHVIADSPGLTDAFTVGQPGWQAVDGTRRGVITFDGKTQAVLLEPSVANLRRATIGTWVKWLGGAGMQPVWHFGNGGDAMFLTPDDGRGHAALIVRRSGITAAISAPQALPVGRWTHLAVSLDAGRAMLLINGTPAAEGRLDASPHDVAGAQCYLARGAVATQPWFAGAIDDFRVWSAVLTPEQIKADITREPGLLGRFFEKAHDVRDATHTLSTGIMNQRTGTLMAWVKPAAQQSGVGCIVDADLASEFGTGFAISDGRLRVMLDDKFWDTGVTLQPGKWQHVALAFDAATATVWVNGKEGARHAYRQGGISAQKYVIGTSAADPGQRFRGSLRDVRLYDRVLPHSEIAPFGENGSIEP